MIEAAIKWIEMRSLPEASADLVANQVKLAWFTIYLLSKKIIVDRHKELLAELKTMMANDYRIPCNSIGTRNPQANTIVERVHQTSGNIIYTFKIQNNSLQCTY